MQSRLEQVVVAGKEEEEVGKTPKIVRTSKHRRKWERVANVWHGNGHAFDNPPLVTVCRFLPKRARPHLQLFASALAAGADHTERKRESERERERKIEREKERKKIESEWEGKYECERDKSEGETHTICKWGRGRERGKRVRLRKRGVRERQTKQERQYNTASPKFFPPPNFCSFPSCII